MKTFQCFFFFCLFFALSPDLAHTAIKAAPIPDTQSNQFSSKSENAPVSNEAPLPPPALSAVKQPAPKGSPLAAARLIAIVGENVVKARRGWVNLEPGSRPAYIGIQGGTAPITLLRSANGSLLGYTGNTGNDFIQLLQGKEPPSMAKPPSEPKEALEMPSPAPEVPEASSAKREPPLYSSGPTMEPFGLSTPEHVVQKEETKSIPRQAAKKIVKKKKRKKRPAPAPAMINNYKDIYLLAS